MSFNLNGEHLSAFLRLKEVLISAPVMQAPDWELPFEVMYDITNYALGALWDKGRIISLIPSIMQVRI